MVPPRDKVARQRPEAAASTGEHDAPQQNKTQPQVSANVQHQAQVSANVQHDPQVSANVQHESQTPTSVDPMGNPSHDNMLAQMMDQAPLLPSNEAEATRSQHESTLMDVDQAQEQPDSTQSAFVQAKVKGKGKGDKSTRSILRDEWRANGRPQCMACGQSHPPPCDPEITTLKRIAATLEGVSQDNYTDEQQVLADQRDAILSDRDRRRKDGVASNRTKQTGAVAGSAASTFVAKKREFDPSASTTIPGTNWAERKLPIGWCDWCLACHPVQDKNGSYHIHTPRQNREVHNAISAGVMPKVDPWAGFRAEQAARDAEKAAREAPTGALPTLESIKISSQILEFIAGKPMSDIDNVMALVDHYTGRDTAQNQVQGTQEPASRSYGSYASAASNGAFPQLGAHAPAMTYQPTGPPSKKRRKHMSENDDREESVRNTRFKGAKPTIVQGHGSGRGVIVPPDEEQAPNVRSNISAPSNQKPSENVAKASTTVSSTAQGSKQPQQAESSLPASNKDATPESQSKKGGPSNST